MVHFGYFKLIYHFKERSSGKESKKSSYKSTSGTKSEKSSSSKTSHGKLFK